MERGTLTELTDTGSLRKLEKLPFSQNTSASEYLILYESKGLWVVSFFNSKMDCLSYGIDHPTEEAALKTFEGFLTRYHDLLKEVLSIKHPPNTDIASMIIEVVRPTFVKADDTLQD